MMDLISRQAAIDAIKALYEWHDTVTEDRTIDHLKRLPSAQPVAKDTNVPINVNDCISRQYAIRIVDGIDTWQAGWRGDAIESIKALPSAQPDSKELSSTHKALDTISRHSVLKAINNMVKECDSVYVTSALRNLEVIVADVPSAQPEMIREIRKWINSGNRGNADYFIVEKIEEIINKYE